MEFALHNDIYLDELNIPPYAVSRDKPAWSMVYPLVNYRTGPPLPYLVDPVTEKRGVIKTYDGLDFTDGV